MVIHPPQEKHSYDEEFTVVLGDWYHDEHSVLLKQFISVANPGGAEPVPDSALIYFAQNATYMGPISGTHPDPVTAAVVPLEMALTNAQRLARGLTPNKPHFRRQAGVCMRCRLL